MIPILQKREECYDISFETLLFSRPHQGYVKSNNIYTSMQMWNTLKDMAHNVNTEFIYKFKLTEEDKPSLQQNEQII